MLAVVFALTTSLVAAPVSSQTVTTDHSLGNAQKTLATENTALSQIQSNSDRSVWNRTYNGSNEFQTTLPTTDGGILAAGEGVRLFKVAANGTSLWNQSYSGDEINTLAPAHDSGYLLGGWKNNHAWLVKVNTTGVKQWEQTYQNTNTRDELEVIVRTSNNSYILAGDGGSTGDSNSNFPRFG